ncbi:hypothetical protein A2W24_05065 [Microgenomates group bacterium RBG_16_45_19]|nr:MAG: hypothetical protein A2W24_05065 [Microgenomates group bacterium RBG_16_45_19]
MIPLSLPSGSVTTIAVIFLSGLALALIIRFLLDLYAKRIADRPNAAWLNVVIGTLRLPLYWTVLGLAATLSVYLLNFDPPLPQLLYQMILTLLIGIWTASIYSHLQPAFQSFATDFEPKHHRGVSDVIPFMLGLTRATLVFLIIYSLFLTWGVNLTPLLAALSIIGAALSFAARDSVGNVVAGFSIFLSRPFKVGDYVIIDTKHEGTILETSLQLTKLKTPAKTVINIPNSIIVTRPLTNFNALNPYFRLCLPLTLPATIDLTKASALLLKAAKNHPKVLAKPLPRVHFLSLTPTKINLELIVMLGKSTQASLVTSQLISTTFAALNSLSEKSA